jgi:hypothetical protein
MNRVPWELSLHAPISIRAEGAWRVTRGSPDVTVAIIDDGFDLSQLKVGTVAHLAQVPGCKWPAASSGHGTALAGLIGGTRDGYPGVAPGCRLLLIALPTICSPSEQAAAFHIARNAGAAVVCCAWGMPHAPTTALQEAISRLSHEGRNGRGALVLCAAPNQDRLIDGWSSSMAIPVSGVTACGVGLSTNEHSLRAPVSDAARAIGGEHGLPEGTSGATALAAGAAALVFSANLALSAGEALQLLRQSTPQGSVLDSCAAASHTRGRTSICRRMPHVPDRGHVHTRNRTDAAFHERRFNGGEHSYLGTLAGRAFGKMWGAAGSDPANALFKGPLAAFTPPGYSVKFEPRVKTLLQGLISTGYGPVLAADHIPTRRIPYGYLLGLAGDMCATPEGLENDINNPYSVAMAILDIFIRKEWRGTGISIIDFQSEFDPLYVAMDKIFTKDDVHYWDLFHDNASHFAGDNLLYYLSYHLVAVAEAMRCAAEPNAVTAAQSLNRAIYSEAFAGHFLSDMFSASHARVPRWAYLYLYQDYLDKGQFLSRLMHQHEGRLGVFLTNAVQHAWYAYGDTGVIRGSPVSRLISSTLGLPSPVDDPLDAFRYIGEHPSIRPHELAATLIYASLTDVLRHCATGFTAEMSAQGSAEQPGGLLGYILDRVPYALSDQGLSIVQRKALEDLTLPAIVGIDKTSMAARLADLQSVYDTYSMISSGAIGKAMAAYSGVFALTRDGFKQAFAGSLDPFAAEIWSASTIAHLAPQLAPPAPLRILSDVPQLLLKGGQLKPGSPVNSPRLKEVIDAVQLPYNWGLALPGSVTTALTSKNGVWKVD